MRILLLEDDAETAGYVGECLAGDGHAVDRVADGRDGVAHASDLAYDVLIVDRMLPGLDGLAVVRRLRETGIRTPVLFLTTMSGVGQRVEGLDAGGDDYLTKPFAFAELLARVRALGRRVPAGAETVLRVADLELDMVNRTIRRGKRAVEASPREFRLLAYLMRNADRIVTRAMLLENVWGFHFDPRTNVVETHLSRLRAKMDRGFDRELIVTVRGLGYSLRAPPT